MAVVTAVQTLRLAAHPDYIWVQIETDDGFVGTGETMPRVGPVERVVHDVLAPLLLGGDPAPEPFWTRAYQAVAYHGSQGAELRALSALDIALWDILGQRADLPASRLLGGPCRDDVPVYNTCVSYGAYRDRERFLSEPAQLARELVDEGFAAMKIWPFDELSVASLGQRAERHAVSGAARAFGEIRDAVGDDIEIALEGHSCWNLPSAIRIAAALEEFRPMWLEDLLPHGNPAAWADLRSSTSIPLCGTERAFTRYGMAPYLDARAVDVVKQDLCWTGGFTEFMKVASMAAHHELPVAPHNCHGPVGFIATLHASAALPNLFLMETVRSFTRGFFHDLVERPPVIEGGRVICPQEPGLGTRLRPEVVAEAKIERSDLADHLSTGWWGEGAPWTERRTPDSSAKVVPKGTDGTLG
ncbi:MAG: mandelate racemase/muconate lactonizing enzyme family protein [Actinobacteria bacterium]|nr:mandelate racemase/muconate lactonizing enzyme family protein [Actinomycetota bacterium]